MYFISRFRNGRQLVRGDVCLDLIPPMTNIGKIITALREDRKGDSRWHRTIFIKQKASSRKC